MIWYRLRMAGLALLLVWSALSPFAGEAMARVTGNDGWLLCAGDVRAELSVEDNENLALLARLSGAPAPADSNAPVSVCDDCLGCPGLALAAPDASVSPVAHVTRATQSTPTGWPPVRSSGVRLPEPRAPPLADHI
ncbi:hypothetical protein [Maricaulis sp.]|uniref:hypothetical protein n=1 Tax=Maricaulis sp. TaxID=1486257 RepID=UPI002B274D07|nr:hypothetical protein [Maricaulis sp.]